MLFSELEMMPEVQAAIEDMGFSDTTEIQSMAIPMIRNGGDVIGRSQTGTGKTIAFAIPAIEKVEINDWQSKVNVLILCPTRELAQQNCEEFTKLTKYLPKIRTTDVYGGVSMVRQIEKLKRANIVIGTPGRIMDHMRRGTINFDDVKLVVLDEADEMLSMGFKEDIETILVGVPPERQTVLFSATMSPEILGITKQFLNSPKLIEIDKKHVTLDNIEQMYVDVPMGRKMDALNLLLRFYSPKLAMVFCNTKKMVDDITNYLGQNSFDASGLHGDMNQMQRTSTMNSFKYGRTAILVATDVAARGIDVNDIDYVINYDIPQENEYYVHRIGRTGRAGKPGKAITICSGRRQVITLQNIAYSTKAKITQISVPTVSDIKDSVLKNGTDLIEETIKSEVESKYFTVFDELINKGYTADKIAAAAIKLHFSEVEINIADIKQEKKTYTDTTEVNVSRKHSDENYKKIVLSAGRSSRIAPNHIVAALTERTSLVGKNIGKIEIYDSESVVSVPGDKYDEVLQDLGGLKICGKPVIASPFFEANRQKEPATRRPREFSGADRKKATAGRRPDNRRYSSKDNKTDNKKDNRDYRKRK